jgi:hypothetical protein
MKQGSFLLPTDSGNISVTDLTFKPSGVFLWTNGSTAYTGTAHARIGMGAFDSNGNQYSIGTQDGDNLADTTANRMYKNDSSLLLLTNSTSGVITIDLTFVSTSTSGFTLNTKTKVTNAICGYMAFGGTDIDNFTVSGFTITSGTASTNVSVGHPLTSLILYSAFSESNTEIYEINKEVAIGFSDGTNQACFGTYSKGEVATSSTSKYQSLTHVLKRNVIGGGAGIDGSSTVAFTTSGFILTHDDTYSRSFFTPFIAINGPSCNVSGYLMPSGTGDISVATVPFKPSGLLNGSVYSELGLGHTYESDSVEAYLSLGGSTGTTNTNNWGIGYISENNLSTTDTNRSTGKNIFQRQTDSSTVTASGIVKSFNANGFTITKTLATNTTSNHHFFIAFGDKAVSTIAYPKINISNAWRSVTAASVNIGSAWRSINISSVDISNTWRTVI